MKKTLVFFVALLSLSLSAEITELNKQDFSKTVRGWGIGYVVDSRPGANYTQAQVKADRDKILKDCNNNVIAQTVNKVLNCDNCASNPLTISDFAKIDAYSSYYTFCPKDPKNTSFVKCCINKNWFVKLVAKIVVIPDDKGVHEYSKIYFLDKSDQAFEYPVVITYKKFEQTWSINDSKGHTLNLGTNPNEYLDLYGDESSHRFYDDADICRGTYYTGDENEPKRIQYNPAVCTRRVGAGVLKDANGSNIFTIYVKARPLSNETGEVSLRLAHPKYVIQAASNMTESDLKRYFNVWMKK